MKCLVANVFFINNAENDEENDDGEGEEEPDVEDEGQEIDLE